MTSATQQPETEKRSSTIHPDPRASLLERLKSHTIDSQEFLERLSSLKSLSKTFFGPTEEEQAILYAAVRLLLGNTSNHPENIKKAITENQEFNSEDDPVKAFQGKLIETVEALQNYCNTILKEKSKDEPEYIFDVRNILIALQQYCENHQNDQGFDLNSALSVTSSALTLQENLTKILGNPYFKINFQEQQQGA